MKIVLLAISLLSPALLWAQEETTPGPAETQVKFVNNVTTPPATATATKPGTNAAAYVAIVEGKADCKTGTLGIAVKNTSDRPILALVEMSITYGHHVNAKDIRVDNLAVGEVRTLGCKGCVSSSTGQTCTSYKVKAAVFK